MTINNNIRHSNSFYYKRPEKDFYQYFYEIDQTLQSTRCYFNSILEQAKETDERLCKMQLSPHDRRIYLLNTQDANSYAAMRRTIQAASRHLELICQTNPNLKSNEKMTACINVAHEKLGLLSAQLEFLPFKVRVMLILDGPSDLLRERELAWKWLNFLQRDLSSLIESAHEQVKRLHQTAWRQAFVNELHFQCLEFNQLPYYGNES